MFFFGAFSGNLLYLILAISYLAGCSAFVFRDSDNQSNSSDNQDVTSSHISYFNQLPEISTFFYTKIDVDANQALLHKVANQPPVIPISRALYIPPLLSNKSHFSGSSLFSRPPPVFLV